MGENHAKSNQISSISIMVSSRKDSGWALSGSDVLKPDLDAVGVDAAWLANFVFNRPKR